MVFKLTKMECGTHQRLQEYLEHVLIAANRAKELVRQILRFSRQAEYEIKPISLSSVTLEVVKLMRASLPSTIVIKSNIENDLTVMADQTQLHQVLMNLCTNAWHAMQKQGGILEVELNKRVSRRYGHGACCSTWHNSQSRGRDLRTINPGKRFRV